MDALSRQTTTEVVTCLKVISDPTRILIMKLVEKKEYCVCQFVDMFEMSQPAISQHLRKLKKTGLVHERRKGQWRFYSLNTNSALYPLIKHVLQQIDHNDPLLLAALKKEKPVQC